jgi:hypothetical protein
MWRYRQVRLSVGFQVEGKTIPFTRRAEVEEQTTPFRRMGGVGVTDKAN